MKKKEILYVYCSRDHLIYIWFMTCLIIEDNIIKNYINNDSFDIFMLCVRPLSFLKWFENKPYLIL